MRTAFSASNFQPRLGSTTRPPSDQRHKRDKIADWFRHSRTDSFALEKRRQNCRDTVLKWFVNHVPNPPSKDTAGLLRATQLDWEREPHRSSLNLLEREPHRSSINFLKTKLNSTGTSPEARATSLIATVADSTRRCKIHAGTLSSESLTAHQR